MSKNLKNHTKQFYHKNGWRLAISMFSSIFMVVANLFLTWLLQQAVDLATGTNAKYTIVQLILFGVAILGAITLAAALDYLVWPQFVQNAMTQYKDFLFTQLCQKNISAFSGENTSTYLSSLSNDCTTIENNYLANLVNLCIQVTFFVGAIVMMILYDPLLTAIAIGFALLPMLVALFSGNQAAQAEEYAAKKNADFISTLTDCLAGFTVIKSFRAEVAARKMFLKSVDTAESAKCRRRKIQTVIMYFSSLSSAIAQIGVFFTGSILALSGKTSVTPGTLLAFMLLMGYLSGPIGELPPLLAARKASKAIMKNIDESLNANVRAEGNGKAKDLTHGIELKNLSFSYEENVPVLKNINYFFEAGKSYAIVGGSGSGKSTLLNLLMAGRDNYEGQILYDDQELRDIQSESLYELISHIQQNVFIFNTTIRENITMFRDFPEENILRAIELSGLSPLIRERGMDYLCGENGNQLSGGEKQRISIARSLLRHSNLLFVDEATAALDTETAAQVTDSILDLDGLTRIVITHDLEEAALKRYDCILTLKNGSLIETGTFEELMAQKEYFYSLFTIAH